MHVLRVVVSILSKEVLMHRVLLHACVGMNSCWMCTDGSRKVFQTFMCERRKFLKLLCAIGEGPARVGAQSGLGPGPGWGPHGPIWAL